MNTSFTDSQALIRPMLHCVGLLWANSKYYRKTGERIKGSYCNLVVLYAIEKHNIYIKWIYCSYFERDQQHGNPTIYCLLWSTKHVLWRAFWAGHQNRPDIRKYRVFFVRLKISIIYIIRMYFRYTESIYFSIEGTLVSWISGILCHYLWLVKHHQGGLLTWSKYSGGFYVLWKG